MTDSRIDGHVLVADQNEALLLAILNRSMLESNLKDVFTQQQLGEVCDRAAREFGGIFGGFSHHPARGCKRLNDLVVQFVHGGSLMWMGSNSLIRVQPHTRGEHGMSQYCRFTPALKRQIDIAAGWLREEVRSKERQTA
jgi:hypothetical protein